MVVSSSESRVNPVIQFSKKNNHSVDKVPPVNTDVLPVSNVCEEDPCGVLISQLVLKIMQHSVQLNSSILNTSVGIEYEAVETSSINVVDQCGS